jgi:hypothetical protein
MMRRPTRKRPFQLLLALLPLGRGSREHIRRYAIEVRNLPPRNLPPGELSRNCVHDELGLSREAVSCDGGLEGEGKRHGEHHPGG